MMTFVASSVGAQPYPSSPAIDEIEFDFTTHRRSAEGSDHWPTTLADNGNLYTAWGGVQAENPAEFGGKSYGILSVDKTLYMWVVPQPGPHLRECRIASSTDHGATWQRAKWALEFEDGLTIPTLLNFGLDYSGAQDEYVDSYFIEPQWGPGNSVSSEYGFDVHKPGKIHLARVPRLSSESDATD